MGFITSALTLIGMVLGTFAMIVLYNHWNVDIIGENTPLIGSIVGGILGFVLGIVLDSLNAIRAKDDDERNTRG